MWFTFFSPSTPTHEVRLATVIVATAAAASAIVARIFTESSGAWIRSLISYLLLAAAIMLLVADTHGVSSPYIFLWTLVAAFAGLFGVWSFVPVVFVAIVYLILTFINGTPSQDIIVSTVLIISVPLIFSVIVWSHVHQVNELKKERDPVAYRQISSELDNLATESEVLINAIGDGVLAVDARGVIQIINPAAQATLGWSREDAISLNYQSVLKLTDEKDVPLTDASDPIKQAINTNQESRAKNLKVETKGGKKLFVSIVVSPLGDTGSGVIIVVRDITKERAEEREQAEFISTASHEMRTPVASIEGYLGLALNPNTATIDERARDFINKAHESAQHLGRLFQDLLDVSKAEDGRLSNNPKVLDIVQFAGEVVEGLQQKAQDKGLKLVYKPAPVAGERGERNVRPIFYVNLDKDHIREVVNNLTENAIKYTPAGEVSVDITGNDTSVIISIKDSGIGIPPEDLPHLFQKFYRVDNSDTREIGGTGLGLYLCRRLAETMGGRIWVESIHGKGSTFFVELPRLDSQKARLLLDQQNAAQAQSVNSQIPQPQPQVSALTVPATGVAEAPTPEQVSAQQPQPAQTAPMPTQLPPSPTEVAPIAPEQPPVVAPEPIQQPAQPTPAQTAPGATPQPPEQLPGASGYPYAPQSTHQNIPLSSIEQNPAAFTQRNATISIPVRTPQNKP